MAWGRLGQGPRGAVSNPGQPSEQSPLSQEWVPWESYPCYPQSGCEQPVGSVASVQMWPWVQSTVPLAKSCVYLKPLGPVQGGFKPAFFSELKSGVHLRLEGDALTQPSGCLNDGAPSPLPLPIHYQISFLLLPSR